MIVLVAYHLSLSEVKAEKACLSEFKPHFRYAVLVNDYQASEPIYQLKSDADLTRRIATEGRCIDLPVAIITHD